VSRKLGRICWSLRLLPLTVAAAVAGAGCEPPPPNTSPVVYDPCAPLVIVIEPDTSAAERRAVEAGLRLWNERAQTHLTLAAEDTPLEVRRLSLYFQRAAGAFHGFYDDRAGAVFINRQLSGEQERAITVAHELGHAFGLAHVAPGARPSVMNGGNLVVEPTASDAEALRQVWGACPP
jgi:hypothetical protein